MPPGISPVVPSSLRAPVSVADQPYFLRARATHDFVVSGYCGGARHRQSRPHARLARAGAHRRGALGALRDPDLGWIHQLAERARLPLGSSFVVTDASGIVLAGYPESERRVGQPMPESEVTQAIRAQQSEAKITVEPLNGGNARLFAFTAVGGVPPADRLYVSVGISRLVAFTEADRTLIRNLLSLGLVGAVALGVAASVGHLLIIRRLREVVRAAELVRAGDLSARAEGGRERRDRRDGPDLQWHGGAALRHGQGGAGDAGAAWPSG